MRVRHAPFLLLGLISTSFARYRYSRVPPRRNRGPCYQGPYLFLLVGLGGLITVIAVTFIFRPSYTHLPPHYASLRTKSLQSNAPGRGNLLNEKVFIAASLYDQGGDLARGQWGKSVLALINLLGEDNVFLSIYENNSGVEGEQALSEFGRHVSCNKTLIFEEHLDLAGISHIHLPDGSKRLKRVAYLAEVRNRALQHLHKDIETQYDKLLYLNDVIFDPIDALQLLFSTNQGTDGRPQYRAACAVDFHRPYKFYDTFAARDLEGYEMGFRYFPWFTTAGKGQSRQDVLEEKDAVRVRSCWGGMVAFDARFFQKPIHRTFDPAPSDNHTLARFRYEPEVFWDSSECCLIHADIQDMPSIIDEGTGTGIYMNPFVRVAYDERTHSWLRIARRFERLYSLPQNIANHVAGLPIYNPRRVEIAGETVKSRIWVPDAKSRNGGSFQLVDRVATSGGFCGSRELQVVVQNRAQGQDGWEFIPLPD